MLVAAGNVPGIARGTTSKQTVNFVVSDSGNDMTATFATSVTWDKELTVGKGSLTDLLTSIG